jgi:Domain of unknown function (DUF4169)
MSAEVVNLRQARKARDKAAARVEADANAARHGRSKADRQRQEAEADAAARALDGHRRERPDTP